MYYLTYDDKAGFLFIWSLQHKQLTFNGKRQIPIK